MTYSASNIQNTNVDFVTFVTCKKVTRTPIIKTCEGRVPLLPALNIASYYDHIHNYDACYKLAFGKKAHSCITLHKMIEAQYSILHVDGHHKHNVYAMCTCKCMH